MWNSCLTIFLVGTIVDSVRISDIDYGVQSHEQLKKHFLKAQKDKRPLNVVFINSEVTTELVANSDNQDWSKSGKYQGAEKFGFAGGAGRQKVAEALAKANLGRRPSSSNNEIRKNVKGSLDKNDGSKDSTSDVNDTTETSTRDPVVVWESTTTSINPMHHLSKDGLKGILKQKIPQQKNQPSLQVGLKGILKQKIRQNVRSLRFSEREATTKFYFPRTPASEWAVSSLSLPGATLIQAEENVSPDEEVSPKDKLVDAIQHR